MAKILSQNSKKI